MVRCPFCQLLNMRDDEVRGTCYQCGRPLKPSPQSAPGGATPVGGSGLSGSDRLVCQIALVLGVLCFAVSAYAAYRGLTHAVGIQSAQATVRKDFVATGSKLHAAATGQTFAYGYHDTYAVFDFGGRTHRIGADGHKPGERFTVYFRPEKPEKTIAPTSPMSWWFAGGAALVGLFLVAVGGGALYLMRPRTEPVQLVVP